VNDKEQFELDILFACLDYARCEGCPFMVNRTCLGQRGHEKEAYKIWERLEYPIKENDLMEILRSD